MDRPDTIGLLVDRVLDSIDREPISRHLDRRIDVARSTWEPWLFDGGHPGSASYVGPLPRARVAAAHDALGYLAERDATHRGADAALPRSALVTASVGARRGAERRSVTLWVLSMIWGAGTVDGRAPWHTARALIAAEFAPALTRSHRLLRRSDTQGAARALEHVPGVGQAAISRWLWAAGLALDTPVPVPSAPEGPPPRCLPTVLDRATRRGLEIAGVRPARSVGGYLTHLSTIDEVVAAVSMAMGRRISAEEVEFRISTSLLPPKGG